MKITRIKGADADAVAKAVNSALLKAGYRNYATAKGSMVNLSSVRLSEDYVSKYGRNISPYSNRKGNVLGWYNWVDVNNTINDTLDRMSVSANVSSQHGKLRVREGTRSFHEDDWEEFGERNVGSMVSPVRAKDAWVPESPEKARKKLKQLM